jgi:hypothetical protein
MLGLPQQQEHPARDTGGTPVPLTQNAKLGGTRILRDHGRDARATNSKCQAWWHAHPARDHRRDGRATNSNAKRGGTRILRVITGETPVPLFLEREPRL